MFISCRVKNEFSNFAKKYAGKTRCIRKTDISHRESSNLESKIQKPRGQNRNFTDNQTPKRTTGCEKFIIFLSLQYKETFLKYGENILQIITRTKKLKKLWKTYKTRGFLRKNKIKW